MEALVKKPGKILGYSIRNDIIYISFSVDSDSFEGSYCNLVAIRFPLDDKKTVIASIKDKTYSLDVFFRGSIIQNIAFRYTPEAERRTM